MSGNSYSNILEIEIDPNALNYLKKNGNVFILTDVENPQYSYYKIKGYDANAKYLSLNSKSLSKSAKHIMILKLT